MRQTLENSPHLELDCEIENDGISITDENNETVFITHMSFYQICDMMEQNKYQKQLKQQALSKLTQEEREALGF